MPCAVGTRRCGQRINLAGVDRVLCGQSVLENFFELVYTLRVRNIMMLTNHSISAAAGGPTPQAGTVCFTRAALGSDLLALSSFSIVKCSKQLKQPVRAFSCLT